MDSKFISAIKSEYTYLIPLGIWVFFSFFRITLLFPYIDPYYIPISLACMFMIVAHEVPYLLDYGWKDYVAALIALFLFVTALLLKEGTVMYSVLCIYAARHTSMKKTVIVIFIATLVAFAITIACSQIGIVEDYFAYHHGRNRHYLGFLYALHPSAVFMNLTAIYVYLRNKKLFFAESFLLFSMNFLLFVYTDSRLSFGLTTLILIVGYSLKYTFPFLEKSRLIKYLFVGSMIFSCLLSVGITYSYNPENPTDQKLNQVLGNRLYQGNQSLKKYGVQLFCRDIKYYGRGLTYNGKADSGHEINYVDSFYIQYLQRYGLVFLTLIILLYTFGLYKSIQRKDYYMLLLAGIFAFDGIITDMMFTLYYNVFLLMMGYLIADEKILLPQKQDYN